MNLSDLLAQLGPEPTPVAALWRSLGVERKELQALLADHRDDLAAQGVVLHPATAGQVRSRALFLQVDGCAIAALSLPAPLAVALPLARPSPLAAATALWLDEKRSPRTRDSYRVTLGDFRAALRGAGLDLDGDPGAVAAALQAWAKQGRAGRELRPASVAQRIECVSSFYRYVLRMGLALGIATNPADRVRRPAVDSYADARPLDPARVRAVLRALRADPDDLAARDLALLNVALTTGRRVAELAALRWRDVEVAGQGAGLTLTFRAKGGKVMRDTLAPAVGADLLAWLHRHYGAELGSLPADAPLWPSLRPPTFATPALAAMGVRGIAQMVQRRLQTHPHALRHTFAHGMRKAGARDSETQARLGHSSLSTTGRYLAQLDRAENPYAGRLFDLFNQGGD